jgi:hypothetical protein
VLFESIYADPEAVVKSFKCTDKYPVYVLRFRMKAANRTLYTLEPVVAEPPPPRAGSTVGRSPLTERKLGGGSSNIIRSQDGRLSPPVEKVPKVGPLLLFITVVI